MTSITITITNNNSHIFSSPQLDMTSVQILEATKLAVEKVNHLSLVPGISLGERPSLFTAPFPSPSHTNLFPHLPVPFYRRPPPWCILL